MYVESTGQFFWIRYNCHCKAMSCVPIDRCINQSFLENMEYGSLTLKPKHWIFFPWESILKLRYRLGGQMKKKLSFFSNSTWITRWLPRLRMYFPTVFIEAKNVITVYEKYHHPFQFYYRSIKQFCNRSNNFICTLHRMAVNALKYIYFKTFKRDLWFCSHTLHPF